jgi:hypothetical protein
MSHSPAMVPRISGSTRLYAVLGDPVKQVRVPEMLNPVFIELGLDAVLVPVHAPVADLREIMHGLQRMPNVDGLLVTVPHKAAARDFADVHSPAVQLAGSTNALRRGADGRWQAENFDGAGFVAGLTAAGHPPAGKRVTLVGAGGAGSAIAAALVLAGVAHLNLTDVDRARVRWSSYFILPGRPAGTSWRTPSRTAARSWPSFPYVLAPNPDPGGGNHGRSPFPANVMAASSASSPRAMAPPRRTCA